MHADFYLIHLHALHSAYDTGYVMSTELYASVLQFELVHNN